MLNAVIRFSLAHRMLILAAGLLLLGFGSYLTVELPIDVFPDLNRPQVVVMIEAPGLAPEDVEALINYPIEAALNGAVGVELVHSEASVGLGVVKADFAWGTDLLVDRQIVAERLSAIADQMPEGVVPQIAPVSSVMGQILTLGMYCDPEAVGENGEPTSLMDLRTLADWTVRQRLRTIQGVSQVFVVGGEAKQYQVHVSPDALARNEVTIQEVREALQESNRDATGGYLDQQGPSEYLVRVIGRLPATPGDDGPTVRALEQIVVKMRGNRPILLEDVAEISVGEQTKRGDARIAVRGGDGRFVGAPAVLLTITKQPGYDTRAVTRSVVEAMESLKMRFPADVRVDTELYQQKGFIDRANHNVLEAILHGSILVVIILVVFLLNFRTTFITLTAIPLSVVSTGLVFHFFGMSLNTMTLGGIAVAIGELVDDAIVDVENIFRRLKENKLLARPRPALQIVYEASCEIRNSIVFGTMIVVLVFLPVFALSGMEGRLFAPLGIAYIVAILSSLAVSLTITPVLSYLMLGRGKIRKYQEKDGFVLQILKPVAGLCINLSTRIPAVVLGSAGLVVVVAAVLLARLERDFLPPFDEGSIQINAILPPGTSLEMTTQTVLDIQRELETVDAITSMTLKSGRAEQDEHAAPVNVTEIIANLDPDSPKSRAQILAEVREAISPDRLPGVVTSVEQPLAHLISAMLSGVQAQIAVKIYGDDLAVLRNAAERMEAAIGGTAPVPGVVDLQVEAQYNIPQLRIEAVGDGLAAYGLRREDVIEMVETAMNGQEVSQVLQGQARFPLVVRMDRRYREDRDVVGGLLIPLPGGDRTTLDNVARFVESSGPNTIKREQVRRRIAVTCNTSGRGVVDVVDDIKERIAPVVESLPSGYFVEYGGQFESQQSASRTITVLFCAVVVGIILLLQVMFRSLNLALQVMVTLPTAFVGAVAALYVTQQTFSIAAMVGFISLCGIAARNGILLINHYLHLVEHEGENWTREMIVRAGKERLAPVLMTSLASGIALIPLALAADQPGKEILYPVATVVIGGLITSTVAEFFVRPALFWRFGIKAAKRSFERRKEDTVQDVAW